MRINFVEYASSIMAEDLQVHQVDCMASLEKALTVMRYFVLEGERVVIPRFVEVYQIEPKRKKVSENYSGFINLQARAPISASSSVPKSMGDLVKSSVNFEHYLNFARGYEITYVSKSIDEFFEAFGKTMPTADSYIIFYEGSEDDAIDEMSAKIAEYRKEKLWSETRLSTLEKYFYQQSGSREPQRSKGERPFSRIIFMSKEEFETHKVADNVIKY